MSRLAPVSLFVAFLILGASPAAGQHWRTYTEIGQFLQTTAAAHPNICALSVLGTSVQGRNLWALRITDNPGIEEDEPEFKYISTMHGDEIVGVEMCLQLIDYLTDNYGTIPRVTNIVDSVDLWIVPLMNPDGYSQTYRTRENANGTDLNRDFPCPYTSPVNTPEGREPETAAIMNWSFDQSFTLSANFHGGALVVNYPYDANESGQSVNTPTPDDDLFIWASEEYSRYNLPMWNGSFYHGITNGADWYVIYGGMQDWSYVYMGCNEVTIELGEKEPPASQIPTFWSNNRDSMLAYIETCLTGIRGLVTDAETSAPLLATVTVVGRDHEVYTDPDVGDYHRMLRPGTYDLTFVVDGYDPVTVADVVVSAGSATRLDVPMWHTQVVYPNGGESVPVGVPLMIEWTGSASAQFHVQYTDNFGTQSAVNDGFESGTLDPAYSTGGDANWFVTTSSYHTGTRSARSGAISDTDKTWLTRTVSGGPLSFWYRVSSEYGYDFFNFYIDEQAVLSRSGNVSWMQYSTTLAPGSHELKWEYAKDESVPGGSDCVWIDDLSAYTDQAVWTDVIALTDPGVLETVWTPPAIGVNHKVRTRSYLGGGVYGAWDESDATFEVVEAYSPGDLNCDGLVNSGDIPGFVLALVDPPAYEAAYPDCDRDYADIDGDGLVNSGDINPFVDLLTK